MPKRRERQHRLDDVVSLGDAPADPGGKVRTLQAQERAERPSDLVAPRASGRAMTLVEMLVALAAVSILAAILIPAVQAARETARRARCIANLRQIGIAMNSYYTIHQMFPPSQLRTGPHWSSNNLSELTFLLPQLEQPALYASINFAFASIEAADSPTLDNRTARNTCLEIFLCPSDGESNHLCSYRFNRGRLGGKGLGRGHDGPFSIRVFPSQSTITDGLSNTAFISERIAGSFIIGLDDPKRDIKLPINVGKIYYSDEQFIPFCLAAQSLRWKHTAGRYWMISSFSDTHYNHNGLPNDPRPTCSMDIASDNGFGLHPPKSYHPQLVNVLLGDGHVISVANTIQANVWSALGTHDFND